MKVTVLNENSVYKRNLLAEHGLSLLIENNRGAQTDRILFDTGSTDTYVHNAEKLGVDLASVNAIVLSHGHFDHSGGLAAFPHADGSWPDVFINPAAFAAKYYLFPDGRMSKIRFSWEPNQSSGLESALKMNRSMLQVADSIFAVTNIPQAESLEKVGAELLYEKDGEIIHDEMDDEQMLVCDLPQGLVIILGCSHRGVINHIEYARSLFPEKRIDTCIGGMHLESASAEYRERILHYFNDLAIRQIVPLHCTGQEILWEMKRTLGEKVLVRNTGGVIEI